MAYKLVVFDWNGTLSKTDLDRHTQYELYPGVRELLTALHDKGVLMAIATMHSKKGLQRELVFHGIESYFVETLTADDDPAKPDPTLLKNLMGELNLLPAQVLMVGDTVTDIHYAIQAGISMALVHADPQSLNNKYSSSKEIDILKNIIDLLYFI